MSLAYIQGMTKPADKLAKIQDKYHTVHTHCDCGTKAYMSSKAREYGDKVVKRTRCTDNTCGQDSCPICRYV